MDVILFCLLTVAPSTTYSASFHLGKRTKSLEFHDFDTMLIRLHDHWPVLKSKHNLVVGHKNFKDKKITNDLSLREMFGMLGNTKDVHFYVDMKSQGYSWYAKHHDAALERVHSTELLISDETFVLDESIPKQQYDNAVNVLCAELFDRIRVLDLEQSSEYTMRELISPVLVRALCLVDDINDHANETKVRLICEKLVSGSSGHGPIDYVMSYLHVLIVIGEAKHKDILDGLYQNLVQQHNALESLADKIVGSSTVGSKRSFKFVEVMSSLRHLGTYGITSTGREWMFSRTVPDSLDASKVKIFKSQIYMLTASPIATVEEKQAMKAQVNILLRIIVKMIFNQKAAINDYKSLNITNLQTKIGAEEYNSQVIATDALKSDESDDEYATEN
jgi:hypothetical protein